METAGFKLSLQSKGRFVFDLTSLRSVILRQPLKFCRILTSFLTYSMQQNPSWEANTSASQENPHILQNPKVHRCVSEQPVTCPYPETTKCKIIIAQTTYVCKTISRLFTRTSITILQYLQCFLVVIVGIVFVLLQLLTHQQYSYISSYK